MQDSKNSTAATTTGAPQNEAPALPDPKHETFAQAISLWEDPVAACRRIFRCKSAATAEKKAAALLEDPLISARIASLQREASHLAEHHAHFSKADLITFLVETIQTPVSTVDSNHRQCQEWTRDELTTSGRRASPATQQKTQSKTAASARAGKGSATSCATPPSSPPSTGSTSSAQDAPPPILLRSKTKIPSKLDAAKLLAALCGWNAPTKHEGNHNHNHNHSISPVVHEALLRMLG